jgi:hypothetical protein
MKIRDVLKFRDQDLSGAVPSAAADRTRTMLAPVHPPNRIVRLRLQDIVPGAEPDDAMTDDLLLAPDLSSTSPMTISPAHRRDLEFIKGQIARLPRQTDH